MLVIYVCFKRGKNLTLKTCAPDFSMCSMTKLYVKNKGVHAVSLFDFLKTWQVWSTEMKIYTNGLGHMTNMATMPIYGKNPLKSSCPEPVGRLQCRIGNAGPSQFMKIMTLA